MRWKSLISIQNLKLAWRRINTGRNLQHKRFFRDFYLVYESAADHNIRELHNKLIHNAWKPNHPVRIYLPKPSGLQRPITLLGIEDQIVLQAIANSFAKKLRKKRQRIELQTVFSNKLTEPGDSIFFTERWQITYAAFQEKCTEYFNNGYRWAAHFDLSAYYDTISHDLLIKTVSPNDLHPNTWKSVREWLQKWTATNSSPMKGHGIPQGPIASDFLAEAFFLPIDMHLCKINCRYIRYVDDIRLFGKTENEVRQTGIMLEQVCRNHGLIPQSKKFEIKELKSAEDAMGSLPSISPSDERGNLELEMTASEALKLLKTAIGGKPLKIKEKSRFRYVMYRAPKNSPFLSLILKILSRHPEHIDAFSAYFANFGYRPKIAGEALKYLKSEVPYSYVRGELWHIVARLGDQDVLKEALPIARIDARRRSRCVALSWGVMHFLMRCEEKDLLRIGTRLSNESTLSRALLAPIFPDKEFTNSGYARKMLKGSLEEQLAIARELQRRNLSLKTIGLRQQDLSSTCKNSLRSLGIISRRHHKRTDWIAEKLALLYQCNALHIWHQLLGSEYEHALQILLEAEARFAGAYSDWLSLQDSFNDIVIRQFFVFLDNKGLPGHSKLKGAGKLIKYGVLIASQTPFDKQYPLVADLLRNIHLRRNQLPGSHPYNEKGGSKNRWLKKTERDLLSISAKDSLDHIANVVNQHH